MILAEDEILTRLKHGYPISEDFRLKSKGRDHYIVHGKGIEAELFAEMLIGDKSRAVSRELTPISGELTPQLQSEILDLIVKHFEKLEGPVEFT